jgi:ankyrin repeat protein
VRRDLAKRRADPKTFTAALRGGDPVALARQLARGADPNAERRRWRPLHAVIQEDAHGEGKKETKATSAARAKCLERLLDAGADPELRSGWPPTTALLVSALGGRRELVELLIARGAKVDVFAQAALGRLAALKKALERDPALARARDASGLTLLHYVAASRMGDADAKVAAALLAEAKLLLDAGADATSAFVTAMWNTGDAFADFGELALAHGAKPDAAVHEGKPLLNQLVRWGRFRQATFLLERGADPNLPDSRGWTATHQAASRGNANFWKTIVSRRGDVDRPDRGGVTPRLVAVAKGIARDLSGRGRSPRR